MSRIEQISQSPQIARPVGKLRLPQRRNSSPAVCQCLSGCGDRTTGEGFETVDCSLAMLGVKVLRACFLRSKSCRFHSNARLQEMPENLHTLTTGFRTKILLVYEANHRICISQGTRTHTHARERKQCLRYCRTMEAYHIPLVPSNQQINLPKTVARLSWVLSQDHSSSKAQTSLSTMMKRKFASTSGSVRPVTQCQEA